MAYQKPQAIIHQQFELSTFEAAEGLRAVIVGPNAMLHRYADSDEKIDIYMGLYNPEEDTTLSYPGRSTGGIVDKSYSRLFVDNALLQYYDSAEDTDETVKFFNKANYENVVESINFNFTEYDGVDRDDALGIRDVHVGDYAEIYTQIMVGTKCTPISMLSRIVGFVYNYSNPSISKIDVDGPADSSANTSIKAYVSNVDGDMQEDTTNFNNVSVSGVLDVIKYGFIGYDPISAKNKLQAQFDILFSKTISQNCGSAIQATIIGIESNETRTIPINADQAFALSEYEGSTLAVTIPSSVTPAVVADDESDSSSSSSEPAPAPTPVAVTDWAKLVELLEADKNVKFTVTYSVNYSEIADSAITVATRTEGEGEEAVTIVANYNGENDETYVAECIQGGTIAADSDIKFSIYTAYGTDVTKTVTLTSANKSWFPVGTKGVAINFGSVTTICKGTKIYVEVKGPEVAAVNGIALADDLPEYLQNNTANNGAVYFQLRLIARENVEVPQISTITGDTNWEQEDTQVIIKEGIQLGSSEFLKDNGNYIPLKLLGFGHVPDTEYIDFSKMYFNYREWLPVHAYDIEFCESVGMLDAISGPLDVDNPLKWAVYKALTNSNGVSVAYVAVKNPEDLDDWQDALNIVEGRTDVYTVVPLTTDLSVQNLVVALVNNESSADACRWKTALFNMALPTEKMVIGANKNNATNPTSTNGKPVHGDFVDNPNESETQFTKFRCTSSNSKFIDYGVEPGDQLRVINVATGAVTATYTVDQVYSNSTLLTMTGPAAEVKDARIEIWHTYTRNEEVDLIKDRAQSFSSRRIGLIWPDIVTEDGVEMPGYFLSAAVAGLKSGVEPYQGLTRYTIQGFDGMTRSKPRYTETQLDDLASSGVWICVEDSDGTVLSRHAITTNTLDIFRREEMMTRNMDSISKQLYDVIDPYIGRTNVNDNTLRAISNALEYYCGTLISGGQMITYSNLTVKQHDLLMDRVVVYLNCALPFAVNNVELYITAGAYHLNEITTSAEG